MVDFVKPTPTNYSKDEIDSIAEQMANTLNFLPGGDLESLVKRLGGKIHYEDLDSWDNSGGGSLIVKGKKDFDIFISNFTGPLRDRFTIAHELGHYILHSEIGKKKITVARHGSDRLEWEANWFAAGFLMPATKFKAEMKINSATSYLASKFCVSPSAVDIRKKYFGY